MTSELLEELVGIAAGAAAIVNEIYATDFRVDYKAVGDPVTDADRAANDFICAALGKRFPDIPIVAEESEERNFTGFRTAPSIFFVDPVDGTREFVARNGEFAVMIGLVQGDRATHGVIHAPSQRTAWAGEVGTGAFRIGPDGSRAAIHVTACDEIGQARVAASRSRRSETLERRLERLGAASLVALGSAGLKAAAVAEGRVDLYVAPDAAGKRWDACACDALVSAAGGTFTDRYGVPVDYRGASLQNDRGVVSAPPKLHARVLKLLEEQDTG